MPVIPPIAPAVYDALLAEASAPYTSPDRLEQIRYEINRLYQTSTPARQIKRLFGALLANPNSPPEVLSYLAYADPEAFLTNPALPLLPLEDPSFVARLSDEALSQMLRFANVPAAFVQQARQRQKGDARRQAEWHIVVQGEADPLSDAWETEAFDAIAALDMIRPEKVFEIVEHHLHDETLVRIFERIGLAAVHAPVHEWYATQQRAAFRALQAQQKAKASAHDSPRSPDRDWATVWENDPKGAEKAARSSRTPAEVLRALAAFTLSEVHENDKTEQYKTSFALTMNISGIQNALVRNPVTPTDSLRSLMNPGHLTWLAVHPNADADLLREVFGLAMLHQRATVSFLEALLGNPNTPPDIVRESVAAIEHIAANPPNRDAFYQSSAFGRRIRRWHHVLCPDGPKLPEEVGESPFDRTMSEYFPKLDYFLLTLVRQYKPDALARIAREPEWTRRFAAAIHPNATPRIWKYLANDGNRFVRACARHRLSTFTATP